VSKGTLHSIGSALRYRVRTVVAHASNKLLWRCLGTVGCDPGSSPALRTEPTDKVARTRVGGGRACPMRSSRFGATGWLTVGSVRSSYIRRGRPPSHWPVSSIHQQLIIFILTSITNGLSGGQQRRRDACRASASSQWQRKDR